MVSDQGVNCGCTYNGMRYTRGQTFARPGDNCGNTCTCNQNLQVGNFFIDRIFSRVHATLQPALSVGRSVGRLVGLSVGHTLLFFIILFFRPHCSCPNDFGSRVSGLVFFISIFACWRFTESGIWHVRAQKMPLLDTVREVFILSAQKNYNHLLSDIRFSQQK